MLRPSSKGLVLFLSFLLVFSLPVSNLDADTGKIILAKIIRDVRLIRAEKESRPKVGMDLIVKDEVVTGTESTADVRFPTEEVITPTATAGVRGTVFSAEVIDDEGTTVIMVKEGKLAVSNPAVSPEEVIVGDLQKTIVRKGKVPTLPIALTAAEIALFAVISDLLSATTGAGAATAVATTGGGISTGTAIAIGAGVVAAGGAIAAAGGGGGDDSGGGVPSPTTTTPTTPESGPCSDKAGFYKGSFSETDCFGGSHSGTMWIDIHNDCSLDMCIKACPPPSQGTVSGNIIRMTMTTSEGSCSGILTCTGTISGNTITGTCSNSSGGGSSWSCSKL